MNERWCERARASTPEKQEALLERADEIRDEPGGTSVAYACYRALSARLDVRRPQDAERAIWLLEHMPLPDPELAPLARAAAAAEPGTELWVQGELRSAQLERDVGRVDEAIERLVALLGHEAGLSARWEGLALANLALCLQQQDREVESLVLCRRAITCCDGLDDPRLRVRTRQLLAGVLVSFHDWERYEQLREEIAGAIESLADADRPQVELAELLVRSQAAFERGEHERSLALLGQIASRYPHRKTWATATRAYVLAVMGRSAEARTLLGEWPDTDEPDALYGLLNATTRTITAIALDPRGVGRERAAAHLDRAMAAGDPPGVRVTMLLHVARALGAREALTDLAKRAYDLAAAAILERILEVDRFMRERPVLFELSAEERLTLGGLRIRFLAQQAELMESVARLLQEARGRGEQLPCEWYGRKGVLTVCAWCGRLRRGDAAWIPVGAFIPNDQALQLSHDICRDCYRDRGWTRPDAPDA